MEFRRIGSGRHAMFEQAFALYEISFPAREQRYRGAQAALLKNPLYRMDAIVRGGAFAGLLMYWELSECAYIEHFATLPEIRGQAVGAAALRDFCVRHPAAVLEIDPPVDEISVRRQGFYHRMGFCTNGYAHFHPAYRLPFPPHPLVVMSYPAPLPEREYLLFQKELADTVMSDSPAQGTEDAPT